MKKNTMKQGLSHVAQMRLAALKRSLRIMKFIAFPLIAASVLAGCDDRSIGRNDSDQVEHASLTVQESGAVPINEGYPSVACVEEYLRGHFPDSYEAIEWGEVTKLEDGKFDVWHKYRRKNESGETETKEIIFRYDANGNILKTYMWIVNAEA